MRDDESHVVEHAHGHQVSSAFDGRVEETARVGNHDAIVPSVAGWARQHGINTIFVDDRDPFAHGFQVAPFAQRGLEEPLGLGFVGVAVLVRGEDFHAGAMPVLAIAAAFAASMLYGAISLYNQTAKIADPYSNVLGALWVATLVMAPLMAMFPLRESPPAGAWISVAALGVLCTAIAYVMYFRLIEQIGAAPTLTVTYLIPLFGVLWGVMFLDERIGVHHVAGAGMILAGIALVAKARRNSAG